MLLLFRKLRNGLEALPITDENKIITLYNEMYTAMIDKDKAVYMLLFSAEVGIHGVYSLNFS